MCISTYQHTCIYTHIYVCMYTDISVTLIYVYLCGLIYRMMCVRMSTYQHTDMYTHTFFVHVHIYIHSEYVCISVYFDICIPHTYACSHVHVTHILTTRTYIFIQRLIQISRNIHTTTYKCMYTFYAGNAQIAGDSVVN